MIQFKKRITTKTMEEQITSDIKTINSLLIAVDQLIELFIEYSKREIQISL